MKNSAELAGVCWGIFSGFLALLILAAGKRLLANSVPLSLSFYFSLPMQESIVGAVLDLAVSSLFGEALMSQ